MVSDEEIERMIKDEENNKDEAIINEVDDAVEEHVNKMGFVWSVVNDKLNEDNFCFNCHKTINKDKNSKKEIFLLVPKNVDKGVVAFCSVCEECFKKIKAEQENNKKN